MENIAIAHYLSNTLNDIVKNCKNVLDEQLQDIDFNKASEIYLNTDFNIENDTKLLKLYNYDSFLGNFMQINQHFFHIKSTKKQIIEDKDKIEYEIMKRGFEVNNYEQLSVSNTTLKKLETKSKKNSEIEKLNNIINEIIDNKEAKENYSYRLTLGNDSEIINSKNINQVLSDLTNQSNKNKINFFGAKIYNLLGVNIEQEQELRVTNSQKDKLFNFLTINEKIKSKDKLREDIENLNFNEKMELLNIANVFQQICDNFVKSKNDMKDTSPYYTKNITYLIDKSLIGKKIDEEVLKNLLKRECDFISTKSSKSFTYSKAKDEKVYFIKNIAFLDLKSEDFKNYLEKEKEQRELMNSISDIPKNNRKYKNNISLKPK